MTAVEKMEKLANVKSGVTPELEKLYHDTDNCVRCGRCTAVCPTYKATRKEMMSARGRVHLARKYLEGSLGVSKTFKLYNDLCLGCGACLEVCPPKIKTDELVGLIKQDIFGKQGHSLDEMMMLKSCSYPQSFRWIVKMIDLNKQLGLVHLLPPELKAKANMFPPAPDKTLRDLVKGVELTRGGGRTKVGYYPGCLTQSLYPDVGMAVVEVLINHGYDVVIPPETVCCGLPHKEGGEHSEHRRLAGKNIEFFASQGVDYIVTNCGTCTHALKEYGHLFTHDPAMADKAGEFAAKTRDIMDFLTEVAGLKAGPRSLGGIKVTYHDSCHLSRRLGVVKQPRKLLAALPGLTFEEMPKANWCCGAAGSYSFKHPATARQILEQKMANVAATGAQVVTAGCPSCLMQLDYGKREFGVDCLVKHPVQLLADTFYN